MAHSATERARRPLVSIDQANVDIKGQRILECINWAIYPGEHWGIVGANGSGKTTLLRLIGGKVWPAPGSGTRTYDFGNGTRTDAIEARTRIVEVGPELQNRYARFGWNFRVVDIVRSGVTRTDIPQRRPSGAERSAAAAVVERLGLESIAESRFLELSRGQQRRVLIARALAFEPAVMLLDEPASGLDSAARQSLEALLRDVARATSIVLTAHEAADLPGVINRVATLDRGRLVVAAARAPLTAGGDTDGETAQKPPGRVDRPAHNDAPADALIDVRDASVFIDRKLILDRIRWQLRPGEHWLVTGANGSGKSTFLRLLHAQLRPARGGSIRWGGLGDPRNVWELRRQVALVSAELQAAYRYPATVRQCIASGFDSSVGLMRRLDPHELEQVDQLVGAFELDALAERKLDTLSYGQAHRALIARTLINRPRVLLLDEPWEGLDAHTRTLVAEQLDIAAASGMQIVCASHIVEPAVRFNRHATIAAGRLTRADDTNERRGN